jgi:hypothetical protein
VFELFEYKDSVIKIRNPNYFESFLNKNPFKPKKTVKSLLVIQGSLKNRGEIKKPFFLKGYILLIIHFLFIDPIYLGV